MKRNRFVSCGIALIVTGMLLSAACGAYAQETGGASQVAEASDMAPSVSLDLEGLEPVRADELQDGSYEIQVDCSSSMFRIDGCTLSVADGTMEAELRMGSDSFAYLFMGTGEEAASASSEQWISPEVSPEGNGIFRIPVEALDQPVSCAAFSRKKEMWYDRTLVFRSDSLPQEALTDREMVTAEGLGLADGEYRMEVELEGGSGRASVASPALITVRDGQSFARLEWSSPNYDYMKVDDVRYDRISQEGNSVFEIPVSGFDCRIPVLADTTAMSTPHEIEYTLTFDSSSLKQEGESLLLGEDAALQEEREPADPAPETEVSPGLLYATQFQIETTPEGRLITIGGTDRYLLVPEGEEAPDHVEEGTTVLRTPIRSIYLAASSAMDFFRILDALDQVSMTSTKASDWSLDPVKEALESGSMTYVGKYSTPDYELLALHKPDLAIESTMIYHSPRTKELLLEMGIPVLVERSSYEPDPLGRMEWIRLYGLLTGKEKEAEAYFLRKVSELSGLSETEPSGQKAAFFYISPNGYAVVRKGGDYIAKMIRMAGGTYFLEPEEGRDTVSMNMNMEMERFYAAAFDADVLIYNSTIDNEIETVEELIGKSPLLAQFKAVKEGNVWCVGKDLFQQSAGTVDLILDLEAVFSGKTGQREMAYLHKVEKGKEAS